MEKLRLKVTELRRIQGLSLCVSDPKVHITNIPHVSLFFLKPTGRTADLLSNKMIASVLGGPEQTGGTPPQSGLTDTWGLEESKVSWSSSPGLEPPWGFTANTCVLLNDVHFPEWLM